MKYNSPTIEINTTDELDIIRTSEPIGVETPVVDSENKFDW